MCVASVGRLNSFTENSNNSPELKSASVAKREFNEIILLVLF